MMKTEKELKKTGKSLIWIILVVTSINTFFVLFVLGMSDKELAGDELQYTQLASNLIENFSFSLEAEPPFEPTLYRTPGYPLFLALLSLISGKSILFIKIFQFFLFGTNAYLLYHLAKCYIDEKTARIAAYFSLIYLPFVFLASFLLTETITIFLILSLFLLIKKYNWQNNAQILLDLIIGILMGVLILVRPTMSLIAIPLLLSFWLPYFLKTSLLSFQKIFAKSFVFSCGILLVFAPWMIRNYSVTNHFTPLTLVTSSESLYVSSLQYKGKISYAFTVLEWQTIYLEDLSKRRSDAQEKVNKGFGNFPVNLPKSVQKEMLIEESYKNSINNELSELSFIQITKSLPIRLMYLWSTADFAPTNFLHRIGQLQYLVFLALAISGIIFSWRKLLSQWLLLLIPVYLTLIYCVFHEEPRYTIPGRPFILIYCAIAASWLWSYLSKGYISKTSQN
jgi:4-amino-4-deoxy-L-arabinose transferase-like glycosyltransferase